MKEKDKIESICPIDDEIIQLDICGKSDFSIRKSTLCHVQGSALEAMFSGRHNLLKKNDRYFIDRNPFAFNLMIDFIRNNGEMHEQQENNYKMLKMELDYWGIDENLFKERAKDKLEIVQ
jgi:hypothetical protein